MEDWRLKYRPKHISEIWGNEHIKRAYEKYFGAGGLPKSIILHGAYGVGKTSFGKIVGNQINKKHGNGFLLEGFHELDATYYNFDNTSSLIKKIMSHVHGTVVLFFDEAHRMPDKAQNGMLKAIEEDPNLYFIFSTTELGNIDDGIKSRSSLLHFKKPPIETLLVKLLEIAKKENVEISKGALELLINMSGMTPRDCIGNLQMVSCHDGSINEIVVRNYLS